MPDLSLAAAHELAAAIKLRLASFDPGHDDAFLLVADVSALIEQALSTPKEGLAPVLKSIIEAAELSPSDRSYLLMDAPEATFTITRSELYRIFGVETVTSQADPWLERLFAQAEENLAEAQEEHHA